MHEDYDQVDGWPAEQSLVYETPARQPWLGECYACDRPCYDVDERCPYCRHFPQAIVRRSLKTEAA